MADEAQQAPQQPQQQPPQPQQSIHARGAIPNFNHPPTTTTTTTTSLLPPSIKENNKELVRQISKRGLELVKDVKTEVTYAKLDELSKLLAETESIKNQQDVDQSELEIFAQMKQREAEMKTVLKKDPSRLSTQLRTSQQVSLRVSQASAQAEEKEEDDAPSAVYGTFDFDALEEDELSFRRGDRIAVIKQIDAHWYYGELNGRKGIFPSVYVAILPEETVAVPSPQPQQPQQPQQPKQQTPDNGGGMVAGERRVLSYDTANEPLLVEVLYDFDGIEDDEELTCYEGDVLRIIGEMEGFPEWIKADLHGKQGWVPRTYLNIE